MGFNENFTTEKYELGSVNSSIEGFCYFHTSNKTKLGEITSTWDLAISSLAFVISGTLGNVLLIGIIHYEKFGGDPQKRSFRNRLTSEIVVCAACVSNLTIVIFLGNLALPFDSAGKLNDICIRLQRQDIFSFQHMILLLSMWSKKQEN